MNEATFREQIVGTKRRGREARGLADQLGWLHVGFRAAMTQHGYRVPGTGPLAKGWPDLTLVQPRSGRLLFVELKADGKKPRPEQEGVLAVLRTVAAANPRVEVHVWTPADMAGPDGGVVAQVLGRAHSHVGRRRRPRSAGGPGMSGGRLATYICVPDLTPVPDTSSACPDRRRHTPAPTGYLAWHEWAERKSRTHEPVRCDGCGLYAIWRRKP